MKPATRAETWRPMTVSMLAALIAGCGGPEPSAGDRSLGELAADIAATVQRTLVAADVMFGFASPVDTRGTPEEIAAAARQRLDGLRAGCGSVTVSGDKVTADFGAAPGCTLGARQISGSTTLSISQAGGSLSLGISFVSTVVDGSELRGGAGLMPGGGTAFLKTVPSPAGVMLRVANDRGRLTLNTLGYGSAPIFVQPSGLYQLTISDVLLDLELCYPVAGTLKLSQSVEAFGCLYGCDPRDVTLAFSDASATTGTAQASSKGATWPQALPPHGGCPR